MEKITLAVSIIGIIGTISSIYFAYIAYRRKNNEEAKNEGLKEGSTISDINYIKLSIEQVLKKLVMLDNRYNALQNRLIDVTEKVHQLTTIVDKIKG